MKALKFLFIILLMFLLHACHLEKIELPDTSRKIVINSILASDSLIGANLTSSMYISDSSTWLQGNYLENANVKVYKNDQLIDSLIYFKRYGINYQELISHNNYYSSQFYPIPGDHYKIVVNAVGKPEATSETTIPNLVKIERIDSSRVNLSSQVSWLSNIDMVFNVFFTDPINEKNFYLFYIFEGSTSAENSSITGPIYGNFTFQDPIVEEKLDHGSEAFGIAFSDKNISGKQHQISVRMNGKAIGYPFYDFNNQVYKTVIYFKLYSITEDYFKYIQSYNLFLKNYNNPLSAPTQVFSNIKGGYGIFSGAAVSCDSIVFQ